MAVAVTLAVPSAAVVAGEPARTALAPLAGDEKATDAPLTGLLN